MGFSGQLHKVTDEIAAVVVVMVADFGFLSAAVYSRDKFSVLEFYPLVTFVEVMTLIICFYLLRHGLAVKSIAYRHKFLDCDDIQADTPKK